MTPKINLKAVKRTITGRKVKTLRAQGIIPANVFGSHIKSEAIQVSADEFRMVLAEAGESTIVNLNIEGETKSRPVLIREPQVHPVTRRTIHVDLRQVDLKEKIKTMIEIRLIGEAPAQAMGALIITLKDQVEVEALPTDLPEHIEVDISKLENIDDVILAKDLNIDRTKVELILDEEEVIVHAEAPKVEVEPVEEVAEVPAEGATPAEGEAKSEGEKKEEGK